MSKDVIRITATKRIELLEEYEISIDDLKNELITCHDFDEEEVNNYTDDELKTIADKMCREEELEDFIVKQPNTEYDQNITVEDINIVELDKYFN